MHFQGTGPWNLEMQVVGPRSSEVLQIEGIETPRKSILVPIPKGMNSDEGTFDINIGKLLTESAGMLLSFLQSVSIEDVYKCKRTVSNPGITVSVKGVKVGVFLFRDLCAIVKL